MITPPNSLESVKTNSIKKQTKRVIREHEVIKSDRVSLIEAANRLVGQLVHKQVLPLVGAELAREAVELTNAETVAYEAALQFLRRQFEQGYSLAEPMETRVESDVSVEYVHRSAAKAS